MIMTVTLGQGALRMAREKVIVKREKLELKEKIAFLWDSAKLEDTSRAGSGHGADIQVEELPRVRHPLGRSAKGRAVAEAAECRMDQGGDIDWVATSINKKRDVARTSGVTLLPTRADIPP